MTIFGAFKLICAVFCLVFGAGLYAYIPVTIFIASRYYNRYSKHIKLTSSEILSHLILGSIIPTVMFIIAFILVEMPKPYLIFIVCFFFVLSLIGFLFNLLF